MNAVLPILIILALGGLCSVVLKRYKWPFLISAAAAATLATTVWVCGCYALFLLFAPSELGYPVAAAVVMTFLTALAPSLLVGWFVRAKY